MFCFFCCYRNTYNYKWLKLLKSKSIIKAQEKSIPNAISICRWKSDSMKYVEEKINLNINLNMFILAIFAKKMLEML